MCREGIQKDTMSDGERRKEEGKAGNGRMKAKKDKDRNERWRERKQRNNYAKGYKLILLGAAYRHLTSP
jgi:hypothetical protein